MDAADTEFKVQCAENLELLKVPAYKPEVGQNIALVALPTARNSTFYFLNSNFFFSDNFTPPLLSPLSTLGNMCHKQRVSPRLVIC